MVIDFTKVLEKKLLNDEFKPFMKIAIQEGCTNPNPYEIINDIVKYGYDFREEFLNGNPDEIEFLRKLAEPKMNSVKSQYPELADLFYEDRYNLHYAMIIAGFMKPELFRTLYKAAIITKHI